MISRRSFRFRLSTGMAALCGAAVLVMALTANAVAERGLRANLDAAILAMARTELAASIDSPQIEVHEPTPLAIQDSTAHSYETYMWIEDEKGTTLARSRNLEPKNRNLRTSLAAASQAWRGTATYGMAILDDRELRAIYYPLRTSTGERLLGVVAVPLEALEVTLQTIRNVLGGVALALLGLTIAIAGTLAERISRPLSRLAHAASSIQADPRDPTVLPMSGDDAEIRDVTEALNGLLIRLRSEIGAQERIIDRQRQFVADASHELRSPVSNLRGTTEVTLLRKRSSEEYVEALEHCHAESLRMGRLIEDLLLLAQHDVGQFTVKRDLLDFREVVQGATHLAEQRGLAATNLASMRQPLLVDGDHVRLQQVVDNLLNNALRYAAPGTKADVKVSATDREVVLAVRNHGTTLKEQDLARLFDRFYRADRSRDRSSGGTGLGLAIVKAMVDAHGGQVRASNWENKGVLFEVSLPRITAAGRHEDAALENSALS